MKVVLSSIVALFAVSSQGYRAPLYYNQRPSTFGVVDGISSTQHMPLVNDQGLVLEDDLGFNDWNNYASYVPQDRADMRNNEYNMAYSNYDRRNMRGREIYGMGYDTNRQMDYGYSSNGRTSWNRPNRYNNGYGNNNYSYGSNSYDRGYDNGYGPYNEGYRSGRRYGGGMSLRSDNGGYNDYNRGGYNSRDSYYR